MPTFRTLCSGGGLFDLGATAAGWTHVDGYEIDDRIASVARLNDLDVRTADIRRVDLDSLVGVDHLHVSPQCKNASQASQGTESPEDLALADATCRAIGAHQGRSFSLENVWGYRDFESFKKILAALDREGFAYEYRHLNAADYGVPQTRKRLILLAVRRDWRNRPRWPMQTHRKGGGLGVAAWVGWFAAIADILDTLPETQPAPWQLARLPKELRESLLFHQQISRDHKGGEYQQKGRAVDEPAYTITSDRNQLSMRAYLLAGAKSPNGDGLVLRKDDEPASTVVAASGDRIVTRAFLVDSKNSGQEWARGFRDADEPAYTCTTDHKDSHQPRAFLVSDQSASAGSGVQVRYGDEPAVSVRAGQNGGAPPRAYLVDGNNANGTTGCPTVRGGAEPSVKLGSARQVTHRAYLAGRWVRMTVQALGRFQTTPDSYRGLTSEINGNGVPCLLAQRIMEAQI